MTRELRVSPPGEVAAWRSRLRALLYLALVVGLSNLLLVAALDRTVLAHVRHGVAYLAAALLSLFRPDVRAVGGARVRRHERGRDRETAHRPRRRHLPRVGDAVFPAPWRARLRGAALAFAIAFGVNFLRVLTRAY